MFPPCPSIARGHSNARPAITLWWLVAVCVFVAIFPAQAQAEILTAECRVFQRYMIDTSGLPVEFDYQLVAADANAPMPEGASGTSYRWTFRRDDEAILKIPVDTSTMAQGRALYTYTLSPVTTKLSDNLYYDTSNDRALSYTLEVYTFDESVSGKPIVQAIVRNPDGTKVADPGWYIYWRGANPKESEKVSPGKTEPKTNQPSTSAKDSTADSEKTVTTTLSSSVQTSGGNTEVTNSVPTAQTGDDTSSLFAFVGVLGLMCLVFAHRLAHADRSKAER